MTQNTISVLDSRTLLSLFGPRDQYLRKIRSALGVEVSARDGRIRIEGEEPAVAQATEVFEQLRGVADQQGAVAEHDVDRALSSVTGDQPVVDHPPIAVLQAGRNVRPRTPGQAEYVQAISQYDLIMCVGPAGTGKTYLAVAMAVSALKQERIRKIVLVRPAVEAGESLGFLPGDLQAKINPYLRPLLDALRKMMDYDQIRRLTEQDVIEMIPLAYMRGRTLNEAFIILDEAQNTTVAQMKMFLTRMGMNSKIVVSGDVTQIDLPAHVRSGLVDAQGRLRGINGVGEVRMTGRDIVRHRLVQDIVRAYDEEPEAETVSMSSGSQKKTRLERVAALELPPNLLEQMLGGLQRIDVLARIGLCIVAAVAMWLIVGGWEAPFSYRSGFVPPRDILARVEFREYDPVATKSAKDKAANQVRFVYQQDSSSLVQLRSALVNKLAEVSNSATLAALPPGVWEAFSPPPMPNVEPLTKEQQEEQYQQLHAALDDQEKLAKVEKAVERAFAPLEQKGVLEKLQQAHDEGNQTEIYIHPVGSAMFPQVVQVSEVMLGEAAARLHDRLKEELNSPEVAQRVFYWLKPKLVSTLQLDIPATRVAQQEAADKVPPQYVVFAPGHALAKEPLVYADKPLTRENLELLELEHKAYVGTLSTGEKIARSLAVFGMFLALYTLSGLYIMYREPTILHNLYRFSMLLGMFVLAVGLAGMAKGDAWRAESIPIMLFGMTLAIVYHQELALLLTAALALVVVVLQLDGGMSSYITLMSAAATAILLLGRIRSRSKLIYVGLVAAVVAMLTEVGDSILDGQPLYQALFVDVPPVGRWAVVAGFLMTGLLPFVEKMFGVLTDISLLEVGDISHPLLQELVRRAPGTYNHSINVASIGEAAADAIGARGLLVRVGAYFHDIGKMLKPQYFTENQPQGASLHETLLPAMSRLIIVAHVKDGADLARQHHMPQPIIDFIEQHHGTTLVEYFYRRAAQQSETGTVEEHSYRYPGPKPLTREAGVLMLADAAESASRALVEPTPSRLEGLVQEIAMNRLLDGQFDQCGITLQELHVVEESLVKSLTAVYHGRVRYPDQKTA